MKKLLGSLIVAATLAGPAAADTVNLRFADSFPSGHYLATEGTIHWMERVTELTDGKVQWRYFPAGQVAGAAALLDAIESGRVDAGYVGTSYFSDRLPLNGVAMLPGLSESAVHGTTAYWKLLSDSDNVLHQEYLAANAMPVMGATLPPYQIVSRNTRIESLSDFRGQRVRSSGGAMDVLIQGLGGSVVSMPAPDFYLALERGTVSSGLFPFGSARSYSVQEVATDFSSNGSFGSFLATIAVNKDTWDSLPADIQDAMRQAGHETVEHLANYMHREDMKVAEEFAAEGVNVYTFSDEALAEISEELLKVNVRWAERMDGRGLPGTETLEAFTQALDN